MFVSVVDMFLLRCEVNHVLGPKMIEAGESYLDFSSVQGSIVHTFGLIYYVGMTIINYPRVITIDSWYVYHSHNSGVDMALLYPH